MKKSGLKIKSAIALIKESFKSTDRDYTLLPLRKAVFLLAVPMVIEMAMESIFALTDMFFLSKLGPDAVATVGITESLLTFIYAIAFGLSAATTALVSRRIGEKHYSEANHDAIQSIITGVIISFLIMVPGLMYTQELLHLMKLPQNTIDQYSSYPSIMFGSNLIILLLFINNAIFRGAGDAAIAMKVLIIGNLINIVLDPLLIFGWGPFPKMGIAGAALATNIGRGIAVLIQFYIFYKRTSRIQLTGIRFHPDWKMIAHILKISVGGIAQSLIATLSWVFLMRLVSAFGNQVVAGYTIALRIILFAIMPSGGFSNAASTLAGQNLGAGRPDRAEKAVWQITIINMVGLGIIGVILSVFPGFFIGFFTTDELVIRHGITSLQIISYGFTFYGLSMVMIQAFNGAGDTITPTWVNVIAFWILEIPIAWLLARQPAFNESGVYYAIIIAESIMAIMAMILFKQGKWKLKKV